MEEESARLKNAKEVGNPTSSSSFQEPQVSLPEQFDGKRTKLRSVVNQVKLYLELQPRKYPSERMKVGFVGTLLTGIAAAWFCPLYQSNSPLLNDFGLFIKNLQQKFRDFDKAVTSANKIRTLKQGTNAASVYATEFRLLASDLRWGEEALIDQYRRGLNNPVQDFLLTLPVPNTLSEAIISSVKCDNRIRELNNEKSSFSDAKDLYLEDDTNYGVVPMEVDMAKQKMIEGNKQQSSSRENERKRRLQLNLCLYCGAPGHQVRNCPRKNPEALNVRARRH